MISEDYVQSENWYTIDSPYIKDEYNMMLNTLGNEERYNFVQTMNSEKTRHTHPYWKAMYVFAEFFGEQIPLDIETYYSVCNPSFSNDGRFCKHLHFEAWIKKETFHREYFKHIPSIEKNH